MDKIGTPDFQGLNCIGFENVSVTNAISQLTPPQNALSALVVLIGNTASAAGAILAYFREDGTDPSTTVGMPMTNLTRYGVLKGNLNTFRITRADAQIHTLAVQYYG
jgi:hypothetical protein